MRRSTCVTMLSVGIGLMGLLTTAGCPKTSAGEKTSANMGALENDAPPNDPEPDAPSETGEGADTDAAATDDGSASTDEPVATGPRATEARVTAVDVEARAPKPASCSPSLALPGGAEYTWPDDPDCAKRQKVWSEIPSADRTCKKASDCGLANIYCNDLPMKKSALAKSKYAGGPCMPPGFGQCNPDHVPAPVACVEGCCVLDGGGTEERKSATSQEVRARFGGALRACGVAKPESAQTVKFTYHDGPIQIADDQVAPFGDETVACLQKVVKKMLPGRGNGTGYVYDVTVTVE